MILRMRADVVVDTDTMTATFVVSEDDAKKLAQGVNTLMSSGGLRGLNPFVKSIAEGMLMNWVRDLIARGWVSLIPDGKLWKVIIKKAR